MDGNWEFVSGFVADPDALLEVVRREVAWTQQMASRQTASMGLPYIYSGATYPIAEWHPAVAALGERVANRVGFSPTNCLLNMYPTGRHALGWHADDVEILAPNTGIAIVSLGAVRPLGLRHAGPNGFEYQEILLENGSLLHMSAAMQSRWKHRLPRVTEAGLRISLSFRHIVVDMTSSSESTGLDTNFHRVNTLDINHIGKP